MNEERAPGLKQKTAEKFLRGLQPHLEPGERVRMMSAVSQFRPMLDGLVVTDTRVVAFFSSDLARKPPVISVPLGEVAHIDYVGKLTGTRIVATLAGGTTLDLGTLAPPDVVFVRDAVEAARNRQPLNRAHSGAAPNGTPTSTVAPPAQGSAQNLQPVRATAPRWWTVPQLLVALFVGFLLIGFVGAIAAREHVSSILVLTGFIVPLSWYSIVNPLRRRHAQRHRQSPPATSTPTKVAVGAVALALLIGGGLTAPDPVESIADTTASDSSQDPQPEPTPKNQGEPTEPPQKKIEFTENMVRAHGVSKQEKGGQSNVRFVGNSDDTAVLAELTDQCINHFLAQTTAAYCYAYSSDADYDHTTFDWTPDFDESIYGGSRPCWVEYSGQPISGATSRTRTTTSGFDYISAGCPGTVVYPDPDGNLKAERERRAAAEAQAAAQPARDACALVDTAALAAHGFTTKLGGEAADSRFIPDGAQRAYTCQNAEMELALTVTEFPDSVSATAAAAEILATPNSFLLKEGGFTTDLPGGAALVNASFGLSEATWASDRYTVEVTLSSQPPVPGLTTGQTAPELVDTLTALASTANGRLSTNAW